MNAPYSIARRRGETATPVSRMEWATVRKWLLIAFAARFALMLVFETTGIERKLRLTKDAFLYDRVGQEIAQYWRTGGATTWPTRVGDTPIDALFEYEVGIVYYFTGDMMVVVRMINVLAGSLVPLVVWKNARLLFDSKVSFRCLLMSAFFPTQVYYSAILVRDSQSTLAMCLIFFGLTAIVSRGRMRSMLALPAGLLLIAGLRTYMFTVLLVLIPACWIATLILVRARGKARFVARATGVAVLCAVVAAGVGLNSVFAGNEGMQVLDLEFLNRVREKMNRGGGALYEGEVPKLFEDPLETAEAVGVGLYHFFFSVDPTEINSIRQVMAIPEVLCVVIAIPALYRGFKRSIRYYPLELSAPLLIAIAITFAYSSVATNGGPMMRWRLQTVNAYILVAAFGWDRRVRLPGSNVTPLRQIARQSPAPVVQLSREA